MILILRPASAADVEAAYRWYEQQQVGLADEFLDAVRGTLRAIEMNPPHMPSLTETLGGVSFGGFRTLSSIA